MLDLQEQYDKIYRYCYFKLYNQELAEDITQETFLKYLEHYEFTSSETTLKYLYTIARNLCIDEYRKQKPVSTEDIAEMPHEDNIIDNLSIKAAISKLSEEDRELLLLRYANDVGIGAMAAIYNISRFAVRRKILAARKRLEEELRKEDAYE
ncbi:RNA polymerase sigma-70 factor, ECF subfamily [Lachnospiraceae bacterium YSD2013]|nr:RNA polymerase sigma factor [Lachnospiraceae bacterium]SCX10015.1 RNA polymerase sigma-70 factor, ECF subfamily [Lachnospiraceae bacterium YSD2013]